jgi:hypothetical protein
MWLIKGVSLGTVVFAFMSVVFLASVFSGSSNKAIGSTAVYGWTLQNPLYWLAFILVLIASCILFWAANKP